MYNYGSGSSCSTSCQSMQTPYYTSYCGGQGSSAYAIILVLFILLVIVLGTRFAA